MQESTSLLNRHPFGFGKNDLPRWSLSTGWRRIEEFRRLSRRLRKLKASTAGCKTGDRLYDQLLAFPEFRTDQKRAEILSLLAIIQEKEPRYLCEIGTSLGGTLFLITQVSAHDAIVISIDLGLSLERKMVHARMGNYSQKIFCLARDSHSPETERTVKSILRGNKLDFLLIDGDHSYDGVEADFRNYSPLVRKGGIIALHDIVQDYSAKRGIESGTWTGDVPRFWSLQRSIYKTEELIENPDQDGYGLGLIHQ